MSNFWVQSIWCFRFIERYQAVVKSTGVGRRLILRLMRNTCVLISMFIHHRDAENAERLFFKESGDDDSLKGSCLWHFRLGVLKWLNNCCLDWAPSIDI